MRVLKNFLWSLPFRTAYQTVLNQRDIDIAATSKANIQRLYQILKDRTYVPEMERKQYGDKIFSAEEFALWEVWREKIVPLFTLKHATKKIDFDVLSPINKRMRRNEIISSKHTGGTVAEREFNYFVLGIGEQHPTPNFLGNAVDTIVVDLKKASADEWKGLWIGNHLQPHFDEAKLDPICFGTTTRTVSFSSKDGQPDKKTYCYKRANGNEITREVEYTDEIFAADKSLHNLFDALFFQFVLELRLIGGEFQQHIFKNVSNVEIIQITFQKLFQSWIYPEAHLPTDLSLSSSAVKLIKQSSSKAKLISDWFKAAYNGDIETLESCLNQGVPVDLLNDDDHSALLIAVDERMDKAARYLIDVGANITIKNYFGYSVMDLAIQNNMLELIQFLLQGVPCHQLTIIKQHLNVDGGYRGVHNALRVCAQCGNETVFKMLLAHIKINPNLCLLIDAYKTRYLNQNKKLGFLKFLLEQGANTEARGVVNNETVLLLAAADGNLDVIELLLDHGANINAQIGLGNNETTLNKNAGRTALHLAALAGHLEVTRLLIQRGASLSLVDEFGDTAYFCLCDKLEESLEEFIEANEDRYGKFHSFHLLKMSEQAALLKLLEVATKDFALQNQNLKTIKLIFESQIKNPIRPPKLFIQTCKTRYQTVVGLVTAELNNEKYVLLVRKKHTVTEIAYGFYLAAGGYKKSAEDPRIALRRELREETNLIIKVDDAKTVFDYEDVTGGVYRAITFFHVDLGKNQKLPKVIAKSDVAEACWVKWSDVEQRSISTLITGYFYKGTRINQSNALLLSKLLSGGEVDPTLLGQILDMELTGNSKLLKAIKAQDVQKVESLCENGLDLDKTDAVLFVCKMNDLAMLNKLIELGANVNTFFGSNFIGFFTPLMWAIDKQPSLAKLLIEKYDADIDAGCGKERPIVRACVANNEEIINLLLTKSIQWGNEVAGSALVATIQHGNITAAKQILGLTEVDLNLSYNFKGDLEQPDLKSASPPIFVAILNGQTEFVRLFLSHNVVIESSTLGYIKNNLWQYQMLDKSAQYRKDGVAYEFFSYAEQERGEQILRSTLPERTALKEIAQLIVDYLKQKSDYQNAPELEEIVQLLKPVELPQFTK